MKTDHDINHLFEVVDIPLITDSAGIQRNHFCVEKTFLEQLPQVEDGKTLFQANSSVSSYRVFRDPETKRLTGEYITTSFFHFDFNDDDDDELFENI